jgi:hypothetical protein
MPGLGQERGDLAHGIDAEALAAELDRIRPAGEHGDRVFRTSDLEQLRIDEINGMARRSLRLLNSSQKI